MLMLISISSSSSSLLIFKAFIFYFFFFLGTSSSYDGNFWYSCLYVSLDIYKTFYNSIFSLRLVIPSRISSSSELWIPSYFIEEFIWISSLILCRGYRFFMDSIGESTDPGILLAYSMEQISSTSSSGMFDHWSVENDSDFNFSKTSVLSFTSSM